MSDKFTKKPEKLASAVYLLTSFFTDSEPLKWKLRTLASDLVSRSIVFKNGFAVDEKRVSADVRQLVQELQSHLMVAKNAGLISEPNHDLLAKELADYMNILGMPDGISELFRLPSGERPDLENSERPDLKEADQRSESIKDKSIKDTPTISYLDMPEREDRSKSLKKFGAVSVKKNARKNAIINLLKRKKEIMVKDVVPLIEDVSEKTIQRELLALVKEGVLKKEGEKRWSRYSLA